MCIRDSVDDERRAAARQRAGEAQRIGRQAGARAAERRYRRRAVDHVGEGQQDQALGRHHLAIVAHAAQVMAAAQRQDALAVRLRAFDGLLDHDLADVLAQAIVAVVGQHGAAVVEQLGAAVGLRQAFAQHAPVVGQDRQAVAGVADPVGLHQVFGHVAGDVLGHALRHQHAAAVFIGLGNGDFHDAISLQPAEPAPVGHAHQHHQRVADDGDQDADLGELLGVEGFGAQAHHVLRRIDRQDEACLLYTSRCV